MAIAARLPAIAIAPSDLAEETKARWLLPYHWLASDFGPNVLKIEPQLLKKRH